MTDTVVGNLKIKAVKIAKNKMLGFLSSYIKKSENAFRDTQAWKAF